MTKDVTVIDKVSDIRATEVQAQLDAGVGVFWISVPVGNLDRIQKLPVDAFDRLAAIELEVVLRHDQEWSVGFSLPSGVMKQYRFLPSASTRV